MNLLKLAELTGIASRLPIDKAEEILPWLNLTLEKYEINTKLRIAAFLSQLAHESGEFRIVEENLNYSAQGLLRVFPKYFQGQAHALEYARKPRAIANKVYANRMGNSTEESGDGYKYRGKGYLQITGKENHAKIGKALEIDLINNPELLLLPQYSALSAGYFWQSHGLNELADKKEFKEITRRINGGYNGLEDRLKYYNKALNILK